MAPFLFAALIYAKLWHIAPLIISISLVYGATRHEHIWPILENAFKSGVWIVGFMLVIFIILFGVSWGL